MYAERLAKRNRRAKRARALPEEEPAAAPAGRDFCFTANLLYVTLLEIVKLVWTEGGTDL